MKTEVTIYKKLLAGDCFIMKRHGNKYSYCIYDVKMNPLMHVSDTVHKHLNPLFKTDKKQRITLNLSSVRQLHGNDLLKQLYKKHLSLKKAKKHGTGN